ncbi:MAG: DNA replication/repair protein RecF [Alphaproteobacteria bacterium]|nr:DNA replication/repair protein RecF [Alphaproteobacteria bacterium]MCB9975215.1 DNA replication/repair protein RecF [Rhodospirillales bacterium]
MAWIRTLKLHSFRSYEAAEIADLGPGLLVFSGPNGAGKTNILEAVSLFSPGRGLRGARLADLQRQGDARPWAVSGEVQTRHEAVKLGTGMDPQKGVDKRAVRLNGKSAKGQSVLADYVSCVWLTPQMDGLFLESSRERRRFLDRLVFGFDPGHSGRVTRYENALSQRSKLLREGRIDPAWLSGLEQQMAETGTAIAAARLDFAHRLQAACNAADHTHFPLAKLGVTGSVERHLAAGKALEVEDWFRESLVSSRERDALVGGAEVGPHKSDLEVFYAAKGMPAGQCSTGEQKALLTGLILAHAQLITAERGEPPILLLDEVAAHLDEGRRAALYEILEKLHAQVWLTGTDTGLFAAVKDQALFFSVNGSVIERG